MNAREIVSTRVFDTPREAVFSAWSEPARLARWWGPKGFTNTFHECDVRPGGRWRFTMHGPDGTNYDNESVFREVISPERIVFRHVEPVHGFDATVTFEVLSKRTRVTFRMVFDSEAECERVRPFVTEANEQNFDRLSAELQRK